MTKDLDARWNAARTLGAELAAWLVEQDAPADSARQRFVCFQIPDSVTSAAAVDVQGTSSESAGAVDPEPPRSKRFVISASLAVAVLLSAIPAAVMLRGEHRAGATPRAQLETAAVGARDPALGAETPQAPFVHANTPEESPLAVAPVALADDAVASHVASKPAQTALPTRAGARALPGLSSKQERPAAAARKAPPLEPAPPSGAPAAKPAPAAANAGPPTTPGKATNALSYDFGL
jgi:hypothetical protein